MYMNGWNGYQAGRMAGGASPSGPANGMRSYRPTVQGFYKGIMPPSGMAYFKPPNNQYQDPMAGQEQQAFNQGHVFNPTGQPLPIQAVDPMRDPNPVGMPQQSQVPWNDQQLLQQMYLGGSMMPQFGMGQPQYTLYGRGR